MRPERVNDGKVCCPVHSLGVGRTDGPYRNGYPEYVPVLHPVIKPFSSRGSSASGAAGIGFAELDGNMGSLE